MSLKENEEHVAGSRREGHLVTHLVSYIVVTNLAVLLATIMWEVGNGPNEFSYPEKRSQPGRTSTTPGLDLVMKSRP